MIKTRFDNITWSIPTLFSEDLLCFSLLNILDKYNVKYNFELYGATFCNWNTKTTLKTNDINFISRTIENFKFRKTMPVLNFDNYNLSGNDLKDEFSNKILNKCQEQDCFVTVSSSKLLKYIRKNYPKIKCIASSVNTIQRFKKDIIKNSYKPEKELKYYNDLLKLYDRVIIRPDFAKSNLLKDIKDLSKVELIVNYPCIKNCKKSVEEFNQHCNLECTKDYIHINELNPELNLSFEEIYSFINLGIKHFRIVQDINYNKYFLLMSIINYVFEQNALNSELFKVIINNIDEIKFFYANEIIKDSVIQNM